MSRKDAASCSRILENAASPMLERARKLLRLERTVLQLLPQDLAVHCRVVNLENKVLILAAPSATWAARLRFAAGALAGELRSRASLDVSGIRVRTRPEVPAVDRPRRAPPKLSMESADLLARTARDIEHRGLQEALYRLAAKVREC
ncbi:MAG: DUF721 domain-containing protein [Gammaproteobacteria bacterium]|jgi:hypothetical protein